jgi:8-oxo-dGTP pyrophosphatase MutT (NUDIX family)
MKLTFTPPGDNKVHTYCLFCGHEGVSSSSPKGRLTYRCDSCRQTNSRALIIDPVVEWWVGQGGEYWHETAAVFVANGQGEFLFFERRRHPFGLTVPAGHVDKGELPAHTARRELGEETGIQLSQVRFKHIATDMIRGDECRRGSDSHRWHSFATTVPSSAPVKIDQREGVSPVWLSLEQALQSNLTFATRYVIMHHGAALRQAAR